MHAYLISGNNQEVTLSLAIKIANREGAELIPQSLATIEEVRKLIKFTSFTQDKKRAYFAKDVENASLEALNAFLKLLEEPQKNVIFILSASTTYSVLPTILSRCMIVSHSDGGGNREDTHFADTFFQMEIAQKFELLTSLKTREEAVDFLKKLIFGLHALLHVRKSNLLQIARLLAAAQKSYLRIQASGNIQAQLTHFAVQTNI